MQFDRHLGRVGLAVAIGVGSWQWAVAKSAAAESKLACKTVNCELRTATNKADATYYLCRLNF